MPTTADQEQLISPQVAFTTRLGKSFHSSIETFLESEYATELKGSVNLAFTSPPFPLNRKKKYGNKVGDDYLEWVESFAEGFTDLLTEDGSLVMEVGNSWEAGEPVMSTLALRALLALLDKADLYLCQQFVVHNPARLPSPAQWVTIDRVRVKDSFTHVWWMSPTPRPKADNRKVLVEYSDSMKKLLRRKTYNAGTRPSEHVIGETSFLSDNGGAIPPSVLTYSNTRSSDNYRKYCVDAGLPVHPARMQPEVPAFFTKFLTDPGDLVFDPFAGSNTTGAVAEELNRRWVSVEVSREYIDGSVGRFRAVDRPV